METGQDPMADTFMVDYTQDNSMLLSPEDFNLWIRRFTNLHEDSSATQIDIPDTSPPIPGLTPEFQFPETISGFEFGNTDLLGNNDALALANDDLISLLQQYPLDSNNEYIPQLPENDTFELDPNFSLYGLETRPQSPSLRSEHSFDAEVPDKSIILQRYVDASSEDESEAPFATIEEHIQLEKRRSQSPEHNSPISIETGSTCPLRSDLSLFDMTDSCSTYSNFSNVSFETRDICLKELGKFHIDNPENPNRWIPFEGANRASGTRSGRSSSSVASDAGSVCTRSTCSSRAPSRRKRSMTNNHKKTRKTDKSNNAFYCTFCGTSFSTKSTWKRHEESIHLMLRTWTCSPNGIVVPLEEPPISVLSAAKDKNHAHDYKTCWFCSVDRDSNNIPISLVSGQKTEADGEIPEHYQLVPSHTLELHSYSHPNATTCQDNSRSEKTFIRFDHFTRHMRDAHHIEGVKMKMDQNGRATEDPSHGVYQSITGPKDSRCGFCGEKFNDWGDRVHHVAHEFWWNKRKIEEWKGDWGFNKDWNQRLQDARLPRQFTASEGTQDTSFGIGSTSPEEGKLYLGTPALQPIKSQIGSHNIPELVLERDLQANRNTPRFPCDVPGCDKAFCLRKDLNRHKQTIHADEKPEFHCPVPTCKRFVNGFTRKDNLRYHIMKLHIDPKAPCFLAMQKALRNL